MELLVAPERMAQSPFAPGTSAFRIDPSLGSGRLTLGFAGAEPQARYAITLLEPDSPWRLTMAPQRQLYLNGDRLRVEAALVGDAGKAAALSLIGEVVSPAGRRFPIAFDAAGVATLDLDADEAAAAGLWELRATGEATLGGMTVRRDLRVAFDAAMPFARLEREVEVDRSAGGLAIELGLEVGAAGRYELRGVLYGTHGDALVPVAMAHAADWLEPGRAALGLAFDGALLDGVAAPFELRDLQLLDQGRMSVLHRQARALRLP